MEPSRDGRGPGGQGACAGLGAGTGPGSFIVGKKGRVQRCVTKSSVTCGQPWLPAVWLLQWLVQCWSNRLLAGCSFLP